MSHRNSRLTTHGRRLLVERVRFQGMPVAHVAKAMGISRQCAHRWVARFDVEGVEGLEDRSSRPHHSPRRTDPVMVARIVEARRAPRGPGTAEPRPRDPHTDHLEGVVREGVARLSVRSDDRRGHSLLTGHHPPLRTRASGRARARGREEARSHPRGWGMASVGSQRARPDREETRARRL